MSIEPNFAERQDAAFAYLRDRARRAHSEGDGLLVNSLCSVALSQIETLSQSGQLRLQLRDLKWTCILPVYWLVDEFMLREVEKAVKGFAEQEQVDPLLPILKAYH